MIIEVNGKVCIPQYGKGSDPNYWSKIFPKSYKKRTMTILPAKDPHEVDKMIDGDIHFENINGTDYAVCNCCNQNSSKWNAELWGDKKVGKELVYVCPKCKEGKYRAYTPDKLLYDLLTEEERSKNKK